MRSRTISGPAWSGSRCPGIARAAGPLARLSARPREPGSRPWRYWPPCRGRTRPGWRQRRGCACASRRLLPRHAMKRPAAGRSRTENAARGKAHDFAAGEGRPQGLDSAWAARRSVHGHGDDAVGDNEVHVRGGSNLAQFGHDETGARNADDFEAPARGVGRIFKRARDLLQNVGIGIVGTGRGLAHDARGSDETREHVDMSVGVVVAKSAFEPDDLARAEGLAQRGFRLLLVPAIAVGVEQGFAGGDEGAFAVMLDGAAFEHEIEAADGRAGKTRDLVSDDGVVREVELAAPAIGLESEGDGAVRRTRKDRTGIAQPDIAVTGGNELGRIPECRARRGLRLRTRH